MPDGARLIEMQNKGKGIKKKSRLAGKTKRQIYFAERLTILLLSFLCQACLLV